MANEYLLGEIQPEADLLGADVIFKFAADRQKAGVVATDYLVLDESFLEGVGLLEGARLLLQHLQQVLVDLLGDSTAALHL